MVANKVGGLQDPHRVYGGQQFPNKNSFMNQELRTRNQLPAANHQLPTASYQPPTSNHQESRTKKQAFKCRWDHFSR